MNKTKFILLILFLSMFNFNLANVFAASPSSPAPTPVPATETAKPNAFPLVCREFGGRCLVAMSCSGQWDRDCRSSCSDCNDQVCTTYCANGYEYCTKKECLRWGIDFAAASPSMLHAMRADILKLMQDTVSANNNNLLDYIPGESFKAKIISSIPDKDQQFKNKLLQVMPLDELAKHYDPNKVYQ